MYTYACPNFAETCSAGCVEVQRPLCVVERALILQPFLVESHCVVLRKISIDAFLAC